ncbi:MAG: Ig-like domain-containing protein [Erysipelotrichales bacterium]|nr:Ig-like domain-containing protein [Erysipelotrichales bacterium]
MKKKVILLPLMLLALVACGQKNGSTSTPNVEPSTPSVSDSTSTPDSASTPDSTPTPDSTSTPDSSVTPSELPEGLAHAGTAADPFNVADAIKVAEHVGEEGTANSYYIKGTVSEVTEISVDFGNGTFKITDDGSNSFTAYRIYYLENAKFAEGDNINVGDEVVLYVKIMNFKGNTPETNGGYVYEHTPSDTPVVPEEPSVVSIKEVLEAGIALANNAASAVQYTVEGTVTAIVGNSYYIQDGDYAFYVYNKAIDGLQVGDLVRVTSKIQNYNGLIETYSSDSNSTATKIGEGTLVTPTEFASLDEITQMDQSKLATIRGLQYVSGTVTVDKSSGITFNFAGTEVQVRTDKYLDNNIEEAIAEKINGLTVNDTVDFIGVNVGWYNGNPQFSLTSADSIEVHTGEYVDVTNIEVADTLEVAAKSAKMIETTVLPANATNKSLEFTSSDEEVATVADGLVRGIKEGTADITIKSVANAEVTATVHVTVTAVKEETGSVTYDFSNLTGGTKLNESTLKDVLTSSVAEGENIIESVDACDLVYKATLGQGPDVAGLKFSTSSANGYFTITTSEAVTKVIVSMYSWNEKEGSVSLDINGVTHSTSDYQTPAELTYEIDAAYSLTFTATKRPTIASIVFVY